MKVVMVQTKLAENFKVKKSLLIALTLSLAFSNLAFSILAVAQSNDEAALSALKADLQSVWLKSDQTKVDAEQNSDSDINLARQIKEDNKLSLDAEEQALLQKLEGTDFSKKSDSKEKLIGSLRDESLTDSEDIKDNSRAQISAGSYKPEAQKDIIIINETNEDVRPASSKSSKAKVSEAKASTSKITQVKIQEAKIDQSEIEAAKVVKAEVTSDKITQAQNKKILDLESRLRSKSKELEETRSRLVLAETQVERLSSILQKSNKQQLASYLGTEKPDFKEAPQPARVTQAVSTVSKASTPEDTLVGIVSATKAHLRSGPSTNDSPLMTVSKGTRLVVETRNAGWYRVITPTGSRAWIATDMLKFGPGAQSGSGSSVRISGYDLKNK